MVKGFDGQQSEEQGLISLKEVSQIVKITILKHLQGDYMEIEQIHFF
jgi:hypothetical protein